MIIAALIVGFSLNLAVLAQERQPAIIGVVDIEYILQNSLAAQKMYRRIEQQRLLYAQEWREQEHHFQQAEQRLNEQRDTLPPEEFERQREILQRQIVLSQREVETRQEQLAKTLSDSVRTIRNTLLEIITQITHQEGMTLVLFKHQVIIVDKSYDMTQKVLEHLNQELPEIEIQIFP